MIGVTVRHTPVAVGRGRSRDDGFRHLPRRPMWAGYTAAPGSTRASRALWGVGGSAVVGEQLIGGRQMTETVELLELARISCRQAVDDGCRKPPYIGLFADCLRTEETPDLVSRGSIGAGFRCFKFDSVELERHARAESRRLPSVAFPTKKSGPSTVSYRGPPSKCGIPVAAGCAYTSTGSPNLAAFVARRSIESEAGASDSKATPW